MNRIFGQVGVRIGRIVLGIVLVLVAALNIEAGKHSRAGRSMLVRQSDSGAPDAATGQALPPSQDGASGMWSQTGTLEASDGDKNDQLGYSLSLYQDTIAVGAPYATIDKRESQGAVYVFVRPASGWAHLTQIAKLTASDGGINYTFGSSVAVSGETIVVGANSTNLGRKQYAGAAYVFIKPKGGWADMTESAKLTASDAESTAYFGSSVAIHGNTVVVGADGKNVGPRKFQGAAYVFVRPPGGWKSMTETARLTTSDGARGDQLGYSAAISGNTVVLGARSAAVAGRSRQGAAYVFVRPTAGWKSMTETAKLSPSDGTPGGLFGASVAISGDAVMVGAPGSGAAYIFSRPKNAWAARSTFTAKLVPPSGKENGQFGYAVAIGEGIAVVGANFADGKDNSQQGAAYVFVKSQGGWEKPAQGATLVAADGGAKSWFGASVCGGRTIVAGAPGAESDSKIYRGRVYVFEQTLPNGQTKETRRKSDAPGRGKPWASFR